MKKFFCILSLIIFCGVLTMNNPACANYKIIENNGKKGLGYKDKIVVPVEYDSILTTESSYHYILEKHGKKGLTYNGKIVVPIEYDNILTTNNSDEYFILEKNGKKGLAFYDKIVAPAEYDNILTTEILSGYILEKNGKKGLTYGDKIVAPAEYDNIFVAKNGKYILAEENFIITSYGKIYEIKNFNPSSFSIITDRHVFSRRLIGYHIEYDGKRTDKMNTVIKAISIPIDIPIAIYDCISGFWNSFVEWSI